MTVGEKASVVDGMLTILQNWLLSIQIEVSQAVRLPWTWLIV